MTHWVSVVFGRIGRWSIEIEKVCLQSMWHSCDYDMITMLTMMVMLLVQCRRLSWQSLSFMWHYTGQHFVSYWWLCYVDQLPYLPSPVTAPVQSPAQQVSNMIFADVLFMFVNLGLVQSIAMIMFVVCLSVVHPLAYLRNHICDLCEIILHVASGHGSVLLWRWWYYVLPV